MRVSPLPATSPSITPGLCRHIEVVSTLRDDERSFRLEVPCGPRRQARGKAGTRVAPPRGHGLTTIGTIVSRGMAPDGKKMRIVELNETVDSTPAPQIVGDSAPMRELLETVARIGRQDITVLVSGETGTGKELIASLVHAQSSRSSGPLVRFNCAAIPGELAEAELFGHARGAFTGADRAHQGFFPRADGGTLVLDEVGELPLAVQAKLLRALQEGEIQ